MFKTDSFLGNKKLSLNQNVWRYHATMQQDVLLHFWVIFLYWNQAEIWKKNILLSSSRAFSLSTPVEHSRGVFRTFELRVLTVIDCPNITGALAPVAPVLNTPLYFFFHTKSGWHYRAMNYLVLKNLPNFIKNCSLATL